MLFRVFLPKGGVGRFIGGVVVAFVVSGPVRAQETGVTGTMPEDLIPALRPLIANGLRQAPEMIARDIDVSISEAQRLYAGYAPMLPSVSGNAQFGEFQTAIANNPQATSRTQGSFYEVDFAQPVFRWGALRNQLQVQRIAVLMSEKQFAAGYLGFVNAVRRQYEGLIVAKMSLRNARLNLRMRQKAMDLANVQLNAGTIARTSAVSVQLDLDSTQLGVDRDSQSYDFSRHALARELGLRDIPDDSIPAEIPLPKYSAATSSSLVTELLQTGARNTIEVQQGKLQLEQSRLQYQIARVGLYPGFSARATIQQWNQSNVQNGAVTQTALTSEQYSLRADWYIFDGFATRGRTHEALLRRREAERKLDQTSDQVMNEAQDSQRGVDLAWRQLQITERQFEMSTYSNLQQQAEFKLGNVSQDDADRSKYSYGATQVGDASTRNGFLSAWCDFLSVVAADPAMNQLPASYARAKP
jgi:outer membrane protein TolC